MTPTQFILFLIQLDKMTKQNREVAYKHFRDLENNYEALPHLNKGITATTRIRETAKKGADALLLRNPELDIKPEPIVKKEKVKDVSR